MALELGIPNPDYLQGLPQRIILDWQAFYQLEPFGGERADLGRGYAFAQLAGLLGKPKGKKGWSPLDFIPPYEEMARSTDGVVDPDTQFDKVKKLNALYGGEFIDKRAKNREDHTGSQS